MKHLLALTAYVEAATGLALLVVPSGVVRLLLVTPLGAPAAVVLGRVAGAALLALGIACWLARRDTKSRAARGLIAAMLLYNGATVAVLIYAGLGLSLFGIGLRPAVLLHAALATWCIACLPAHWTATAARRLRETSANAIVGKT